MRRARVNWIFVVVTSAVLVSLILVVFRYRYVVLNSTVYRIDTLTGYSCRYPCQDEPPQAPATNAASATPTPFNAQSYIATQPLKDQLAYTQGERLSALQAAAPSMSLANFGPQLDVNALRLDVVLKDAFESSDGILYVIYSHCASEGAGCERFHLGILGGSGLTEIWLPHKPKEWTYAQLLPASAGDTAIVQADDDDGTFQYAVNTRQVVRTHVSATTSSGAPPPRTLQSGERCRTDQSPASPTLLWAVDAAGRERALLSKAAFLTAANNTIRIGDVANAYCTHFHGVDMLVLGDVATFVLAPDRIFLAAPTGPSFATANHLVFMSTEVDPQGGVVGYWDYLDVTLKYHAVAR